MNYFLKSYTKKKWIKQLNVRPETINTKENTDNILFDMDLSNMYFLDISSGKEN